MELEEFVRTALVEIASGVAGAREEVVAQGGLVGAMRAYGSTNVVGVITDDAGRQITTVEFDIALAETKGTDTKGGIGVFLGSVGLGTQGASHGEASSHSRVKFSVPVVLPGPPS